MKIYCVYIYAVRVCYLHLRRAILISSPSLSSVRLSKCSGTMQNSSFRSHWTFPRIQFEISQASRLRAERRTHHQIQMKAWCHCNRSTKLMRGSRIQLSAWVYKNKALAEFIQTEDKSFLFYCCPSDATWNSYCTYLNTR